jgi:cytoskeleton protein RodZ
MNEENNNNPDNENIDSTITSEPVNSNVQALTIGQLIKGKREEKNLTLKVISQQTKIHIGLLEFLENDQLDKLPSKTYIRGFVKSTAKILGINQEVALLALENTYKTEAPKIEKKVQITTLTQNSTQPIGNDNKANSIENVKSISLSYLTTGVKITTVIVVVVIIIFNLKNYINFSSDDSKLKLPVVLTTIHQKAKPTPKPAKEKEAPKDPTKVEAPIAVNIIQDKKDTPEKNEVTIKDVNLKTPSLAEKQYSIDKSLSKDELEVYLPSRFKVKVTPGMENVFINAVDGDSWITYKADDKEIKKYVLRQGRTVFIHGANIRLFIGNTKNVKVFYNNLPLNITAKSSMKNLVFPEELKTKYMNPLFVFQKDGTAVTSDEYLKNNKELPPTTKAKAQ